MFENLNITGMDNNATAVSFIASEKCVFPWTHCEEKVSSKDLGDECSLGGVSDELEDIYVDGYWEGSLVFWFCVKKNLALDLVGDAFIGVSLIVLRWFQPTTCYDGRQPIIKVQFISASRNTYSSMFW